MITKIELREMKFYAYHGVMPQETVVGNHFTVDLTLNAPLSKAVENDRLEDTLNYAEIYETIRSEMAIPSQLLEHAAGRIIRALRERFPVIETMEIRLAKLNPPFGGDLHSAAIVVIDSK